MLSVDIAIVGAGVVGLAVAGAVAGSSRAVVVLEQEAGPGRHTSSRNSEVIHAGIYYPTGSLKASLCVRGARMLYDFCVRHGIAHKKTGKVIVAASHAEEPGLEALLQRGMENGVEGLALITQAELGRIEPNVRGTCALSSPHTGILDTHGLLRRLEAMAADSGCTILYRTRLCAVTPVKDGFVCRVEGPDGQEYSFASRVVVNAAGLWADHVALLAGIDCDSAGYRIHKVKGQYFRVRRSKQALVHGLVYPSPETDLVGLGIHATKDLSGALRLGPDASYVDTIDYDVDSGAAGVFLDRARTILPFLEEGDLHPDTAGIRPKLQAEGGPFSDFEIRHEADRGLPGMITLAGIESPGLTSCLSIAELVKGMVEDSGLL
ncbi:MAG TPA: NAD(P)/FAD-dependent oxidoreductase [Deltaproteobacteria bacterium]|nr:NAD(P)/FAD-dependent oxidoreductase [Deltaproteobacteria bacterium]